MVGGNRVERDGGYLDVNALATIIIGVVSMGVIVAALASSKASMSSSRAFPTATR